MRIAFVGKGGSGKTTLSSLTIEYLKKTKLPILAIDADINMHLGGLIGFDNNTKTRLNISDSKSAKEIKTYLKGDNDRIRSLVEFRKTTPPNKLSNFVNLSNKEDYILSNYTLQKNNIYLMNVGTYERGEIGASCYHNNLSILENILSHLIDKDGYVISDMVAGIDAFAGSLHAQFDRLFLSVEPTRRGIDVYNQYIELARVAGVDDLLFVIGNKIRNDKDKNFLKSFIPEDKIVGYLYLSEYLSDADQEYSPLDINKLEENNMDLFFKIKNMLDSITPDLKNRLDMLYKLHRKYVLQDSIVDRFGDLTSQIDSSFDPNSI